MTPSHGQGHQMIFQTDQAARLMNEITTFLTAP
jgi:hypothetical protein